MNWRPQYRWSAVWTVGLIAAFPLCGWFAADEWRRAQRTLVELEQKKRERDFLVQCSPAVNEANLRIMKAELEKARAVRGEFEMFLPASDFEAKPSEAPLKPRDAYADLIRFAEKTRKAVAEAKVQLKPDEYFGFASYEQEGPEAALIPTVFRQRQMLDSLLEKLWKSGPTALIAVQREIPGPSAARRGVKSGAPGIRQAPPATNSSQREDFFVPAGSLLLRKLGRIESDAFRLEFTGDTGVLREFLNRLAIGHSPVVVCSVEVDRPVAKPNSPTALPIAPGNALNPGKQARFIVVVEVVRPMGSSGRPSS